MVSKNGSFEKNSNRSEEKNKNRINNGNPHRKARQLKRNKR
jgi:hypothetical protein